MNNKPKLFFIIQYIGTLKYYVRLMPYLQNKYDVNFLVITRKEKHHTEVIDYCKKMQYPFYSIREGLENYAIPKGFFDKNVKFRIPFYTLLRKRYLHSEKCREFLLSTRPAKLITSTVKFPHDAILKEANKLGIETIFLQWAFSAHRYFGKDNEKRSKKVNIIKIVHLQILRVLCALLDFRFKESKYALTIAVPQKIGVFDEEEGVERARFFDSRTIKVVGTIDYQLAHELKRRINVNALFRKKLLEKYGLEEGRLNIVVIIFRFYMTGHMTRQEHVAHYYNVFKAIRSIFSVNEANILLKMHPSEDRLYESYIELGVKLYHDESRVDELVCLSDLYIADPATSANYLALGSNTPALFLNLSTAPINNCAPSFKIKHVATNEQEFLTMLQSFKNGTLEKQYDNEGIDTKSIHKVVEFITTSEERSAIAGPPV